METEITVSAKGQVVIPHEARKALGIGAGTRLKFRRQGRTMVIEPVDEGRSISPEECWERLDALTAKRNLPPPPSDAEMTTAINRMFHERGDEFKPSNPLLGKR